MQRLVGRLKELYENDCPPDAPCDPDQVRGIRAKFGGPLEHEPVESGAKKLRCRHLGRAVRPVRKRTYVPPR